MSLNVGYQEEVILTAKHQHFANTGVLVVSTVSTGRFSFPKEITDIQRKYSAANLSRIFSTSRCFHGGKLPMETSRSRNKKKPLHSQGL